MPFKSPLIYRFLSISFFFPLQFISWKKSKIFFCSIELSFHSLHFADSIPTVSAILKTHVFRCCPSYCHSFLNIPLTANLCYLSLVVCALLEGRGISRSVLVTAVTHTHHLDGKHTWLVGWIERLKELCSFHYVSAMYTLELSLQPCILHYMYFFSPTCG